MTLNDLIKQGEENWQKERTDAISEMFDNVDEYGIYPTTEFFERIDKAFTASLTRTVKAVLEEVKLEKESVIYSRYETETIRGYNRAVADQSEKIKNLLS